MVDFILLVTLIVCLITDLRNRKILNIITLPAICFGLLYFTITNGWGGFLYSGKGMLIGIGVMLLPFLFGGMGAGDVKLMAAVGALKGAAFVFYAFIYTSLIGGLLAICVLLIKKQLMPTLKRIGFSLVPGYGLPSSTGTITIPYGVAIAAGTILVYVWSGF